MSRIRLLQSHKVHHVDGTDYEGKILEEEFGVLVTTNIKETFIPYVQVNRIEKRFGHDDTEDDA